MSKVAVVYWSGTGNTEAMAAAVVAGAQGAGADATLFSVAQFGAEKLAEYDAVGFGCPAMGAETLEESEFEPMFQACVAGLSGKRVGLFGSYGWGDGEWMRTWHETCADAGVQFAADDVICNDAPDDTALSSCKALGAALAS
ncbi:MAG: flavodoxin [Oscillospiraceae bacterium]|nr:flavodoxin [Oscillospiraceae bacterium]